VNPFLTNHELYFPPFALGSPAAPHLFWGLLTDVFSADGSRGTVAAEDAAAFGIVDRMATQSGSFIVPRVSKKDGQPLVYRLEPYVPMVSQGERRLANVPTHAFKFPSGSLTATITRPDAQVVTLGPQPFPGVPADVTVDATLVVNSDPAQAVTLSAHGTANRFGTFTPSPGSPPLTMTGPGELVVNTVATYTDVDGVLWMGATRWGQVVAQPNSSFVAHGRHEIDDVPIASARQWFSTG